MVFTNDSVTLAMLSFFSTTVDDFCVILIFFAREYVKTHKLSDPQTFMAFVKISIGQILGFSIIVVVSLVLGMALHSVVDSEYIDLVGLLPILIGLYKVYELLDDSGALRVVYNKLCCLAATDEDDSAVKVGTDGENTPLMGSKKDSMYEEFSKQNMEDGLQGDGLTETEEEMDAILNAVSLESLDAIDQSNSCVLCFRKVLCFLDPLIFEVTIYALMFGTDNIAIYVALFSGVSLLESIAVCVFFYSLLLVYLLVAMFIITQVCTARMHCTHDYMTGRHVLLICRTSCSILV